MTSSQLATLSLKHENDNSLDLTSSASLLNACRTCSQLLGWFGLAPPRGRLTIFPRLLFKLLIIGVAIFFRNSRVVSQNLRVPHELYCVFCVRLRASLSGASCFESRVQTYRLNRGLSCKGIYLAQWRSIYQIPRSKFATVWQGLNQPAPVSLW